MSYEYRYFNKVVSVAEFINRDVEVFGGANS